MNIKIDWYCVVLHDMFFRNKVAIKTIDFQMMWQTAMKESICQKAYLDIDLTLFSKIYAINMFSAKVENLSNAYKTAS